MKEKRNVILDMGWGRIIFSNTFTQSQKIVDILRKERKGKRDIVVYNSNPHLILSKAPQEIFLDPSTFYRLNLKDYKKKYPKTKGFYIRKINNSEIKEFNKILSSREMIVAPESSMKKNLRSRTVDFFAAFDKETEEMLGVATGIDHKLAFNDSENGASFWSLAVKPEATYPGIGFAMVKFIASYYKEKGRNYLDLSVMHENREAKSLYQKLGFMKINMFSLKRKNPLNEPLFISPEIKEKVNPYAKIIIDEARKRGILAEITDRENSYFTLSFGGRIVSCRESLTDLTNAISMSKCQDKEVARKILSKKGIKCPKQIVATSKKRNHAFIKKHKKIVVKPGFGEKGKGISLGVSNKEELEKAIKIARTVSRKVLLEEQIEGHDIRIVVIGGEMVAAAVRHAPKITGNGKHKIIDLLNKYNRRRMFATAGESKVPLDSETKKTIEEQGYSMDSVLPEGKTLRLRESSNLHTGGSLEDVTGRINKRIENAAIKIARILGLPVAGIDFIMPRVGGKQYYFIEANERPDLANHEPNPTAEKFIDLLFPQTKL